MRAMQPVLHKLFPGYAFTLRTLRFVMWENIVHAAAVDIDLIAQNGRCHCAALNVPSGSARSPWRIPFHIAIVFVPRFPKREVADVLLVVLIMLNAPGWFKFGKVEMREFSVIRELVDPVINRFVVRLVGQSF